MSNRERVIYDIERCICHVPDACQDCSKYVGAYTPNCMEQLLADALELLKEQEPVEPVNVRWEMNIRGGTCPRCLNWVQRSYNYCPFCGRKVKWDD